MKKILCIALAAAMLIALVPATALAAEQYVATVNGVQYATMEEALANWSAGKTLTLLDDVQTSSEFRVTVTRTSGNWTLNLGDYTWTTSGCNAIELYAAGVEAIHMNQGLIINATQNGGIDAGQNYCVEYVNDPYISTLTKTESRGYRPYLYINGGTYTGAYVYYYLTSAWSSTPTGAAVTIRKGADDSVPVFQGKLALAKCIANFYSGIFNGDINTYVVSSTSDVTIYTGTKFKTLIKNGNDKIVSYKAPLLKTADYWEVGSVSGEAYQAKVNASSVKPGSWALTAGGGYPDSFVYFASAEEAAASYAKLYLNTDITAAFAKGVTSTFEVDATSSGAEYTGTVTLNAKSAKFIVSGTFAGAVNSGVEGYKVVDTTNENTKTYTLAPIIAKIEKTGETYSSLAEAATAAGADEITLLGDASLSADLTLAGTLKVPAGYNATINTNGYKITSSANPAFDVLGTLTVVGGSIEYSGNTAFKVQSKDSLYINGTEITTASGNIGGITFHTEGGKVVVDNVPAASELTIVLTETGDSVQLPNTDYDLIASGVGASFTGSSNTTYYGGIVQAAAAATAADAGTLTLFTDGTLTEDVDLSGVTVDLNGKDLTAGAGVSVTGADENTFVDSSASEQYPITIGSTQFEVVKAPSAIQTHIILQTIVPSDGKSEVAANADVTYMIVITPSVDFGTISRGMDTQTKPFVVAVEDALIEGGASLRVQNTTADMTMKDKDGAGSETLAFALAQPSGLFTFAQADLADGEESITSSVSCNPSELDAAGSYKGYMTFVVSYIAGE